MKMKCIIFMVLLSSQLCNGAIYVLNDTEYLKMPPVFHLDNYDSCLYETNGTYCYVEIDLVSDTPSELLQMIHEYSEHTLTHFNHTQLHRGICLTKTCKYFFQQHKTLDRRLTLERCLNESMWRDYKLKIRISNLVSCEKLDDPVVINFGDIGAAVLFVCLVLLNVSGSLYDFIIYKGGNGKGHQILLSFSVKRNWRKLNEYNTDGFQKRLQGLDGIRALTATIIILLHSLYPFIINTENPHYLEKLYSHMILSTFYSGQIFTQSFFVMTGCLMAYNIRKNFENNKSNWILILKQIILRWLRLTPAYTMVLIFMLTWIRVVASGPLWEIEVGREVADGRRDGWFHMFYLNNYIDNSQCMAQTWYLAADMQLYILGVFVCILLKTARTRNLVLTSLFIIGAVIPAIHTYFQDLDAILLVTPETSRNVFMMDPTFNHSYKRTHTNIPGFVLGLIVGNILFSGSKNEKKIERFKNLGFLYYLTVPMIFSLLFIGKLFYGNGPRLSIYLRTSLAAIIRPLYSVLLGIFIIGMVYKFENLYRRILEWRGFRVPARVSYSAYLIHVPVIRIFAGMNTTLSRVGVVLCAKEALGIVLITFLIAYPFWLFVEAPLNQAVLIICGLSKEDKKEKSTAINNDVQYDKAMTEPEDQTNILKK